MVGILGIIFIFAVAILLSENRRAIRVSVIARAFGLQVALAVLVLYSPGGQRALTRMAAVVGKVVDYAQTGRDFMFGELATETKFIVALDVLPVIVFVSALVAILYYIGVMQLVIRYIGGALRWIVGVSGIECLAAAANIFIGMIEAPLAIRPYLASLSRSQFFAILAGGANDRDVRIMRFCQFRSPRDFDGWNGNAIARAEG